MLSSIFKFKKESNAALNLEQSTVRAQRREIKIYKRKRKEERQKYNTLVWLKLDEFICRRETTDTPNDKNICAKFLY